MMKLLILGVSAVMCFSTTVHADKTAQARLFCLSLRFQEGVFQGLLGDVTLDLSSISPNTLNGELEPTFNPSTPDHFSYFHMWDTFFEETIEDGFLYLNLPDFVDGNGNGFDDFFEVAQPVSGAKSAGTFSSPGVDSGTIQATWSRAAGSPIGTCVLSFKNASGSLGDFTHAFEVLEYSGKITYTPSATNVSASLSVTNTGDPSSSLTGATLFLKAPTNRFDELELQPGVWTNASGTLSYTNDLLFRDMILETNYYGFVDFDDGDPGTSDPDYLTWVISIDDPNDSNGNGIPDFSDDTGSTNAVAPSLSLVRGATELSLSIHGAVGQMHEIQQIGALDQTNWITVLSITLTNDPQSFLLPLPTNATRFWRARVP